MPTHHFRTLGSPRAELEAAGIPSIITLGCGSSTREHQLAITATPLTRGNQLCQRLFVQALRSRTAEARNEPCIEL